MKMSNSIMNFFKTKMRLHWLGATLVLVALCFMALHYSEQGLPRFASSNGFMAIASAFIGVMLTAFAISFQLKHQADSVSKRDKDIKIFEQKIRVYSEFTQKLWEALDDGKVTDEELKELRAICFRTLVFYLDCGQIMKLAKQIDVIQEMPMRATSEITHILQENLNNPSDRKTSSEDERLDSLTSLFKSFGKIDRNESAQTNESVQNEPVQTVTGITYWHFTILHEKEQFEAFKRRNWVLALIEHGDEKWRTNLIRKVKPNDVIFLYQTGDCGYVGLFRAKDPHVKVLEAEKVYSVDDRKNYDIYGGLEDGANLASNILVEPIAYNFKGIGYDIARKRKAIERIKDPESIAYLLNLFHGKGLEPDRFKGKGFFDDDGEKVPVNENYFMEILSQNNLLEENTGANTEKT